MLQDTPQVLLVTPAIHASRGDTGVLIDDKALSGLVQYATHWPGRVRCVFREGPADRLAFAREWQPASLPFEVVLIGEDAKVPDALLADAAIVMASGDNHRDLPLARSCTRLGVPLVYVIENTLATRCRIAMLERRPLRQRLRTVAWQAMTEVRRRLAFRHAAGLAANGVDASRAYARGTRLITFFDGRATREMMATEEELAAKLARLRSGAPLRLGFSGRLEPLKGADDLIRVARCLADAGVHFTLDIFGTGSLESGMRRQVVAAGLHRHVALHGSVDYHDVLVPFFRSNIDVFVCCHRQSDPSCTYLEAMACGVALAGYANGALRGLLAQSDAGLEVPMNRPDRLADAIAALSTDRERLAQLIRNALALASVHDVASTFARRVGQCLQLARAPDGPSRREVLCLLALSPLVPALREEFVVIDGWVLPSHLFRTA